MRNYNRINNQMNAEDYEREMKKCSRKIFAKIISRMRSTISN